MVDILVLEKFKEDLIKFLNDNSHIMLESKYLILLNLCETIRNSLVEKQLKLKIESYKEAYGELPEINLSAFPKEKDQTKEENNK